MLFVSNIQSKAILCTFATSLLLFNKDVVVVADDNYAAPVASPVATPVASPVAPPVAAPVAAAPVATASYLTQHLQVCEDSKVEVTSIDLTCNSPRTFYYGNGANRNSETCDYGDKAQLTVNFDVVEEIYGEDDESYGDGGVYITMAIYTPDTADMLYKINTSELCTGFVGQSSCDSVGSYNFTKNIIFNSVANGTSFNFYPDVKLAFSSNNQGGSNLGGANIAEGLCEQGRNNNNGGQNDDEYIDTWINTFDSDRLQKTTELHGVIGFFCDFGILLGTLFFMITFAVLMGHKSMNESMAISGSRYSSGKDVDDLKGSLINQ